MSGTEHRGNEATSKNKSENSNFCRLMKLVLGQVTDATMRERDVTVYFHKENYKWIKDELFDYFKRKRTPMRTDGTEAPDIHMLPPSDVTSIVLSKAFVADQRCSQLTNQAFNASSVDDIVFVQLPDVSSRKLEENKIYRGLKRTNAVLQWSEDIMEQETFWSDFCSRVWGSSNRGNSSKDDRVVIKDDESDRKEPEIKDKTKDNNKNTGDRNNQENEEEVAKPKCKTRFCQTDEIKKPKSSNRGVQTDEVAVEEPKPKDKGQLMKLTYIDESKSTGKNRQHEKEVTVYYHSIDRGWSYDVLGSYLTVGLRLKVGVDQPVRKSVEFTDYSLLVLSSAFMNCKLCRELADESCTVRSDIIIIRLPDVAKSLLTSGMPYQDLIKKGCLLHWSDEDVEQNVFWNRLACRLRSLNVADDDDEMQFVGSARLMVLSSAFHKWNHAVGNVNAWPRLFVYHHENDQYLVNEDMVNALASFFKLSIESDEYVIGPATFGRVNLIVLSPSFVADRRCSEIARSCTESAVRNLMCVTVPGVAKKTLAKSSPYKELIDGRELFQWPRQQDQICHEVTERLLPAPGQGQYDEEEEYGYDYVDHPSSSIDVNNAERRRSLQAGFPSESGSGLYPQTSLRLVRVSFTDDTGNSDSSEQASIFIFHHSNDQKWVKRTLDVYLADAWNLAVARRDEIVQIMDSSSFNILIMSDSLLNDVDDFARTTKACEELFPPESVILIGLPDVKKTTLARKEQVYKKLIRNGNMIEWSDDDEEQQNQFWSELERKLFPPKSNALVLKFEVGDNVSDGNDNTDDISQPSEAIYLYYSRADCRWVYDELCKYLEEDLNLITNGKDHEPDKIQFGSANVLVLSEHSIVDPIFTSVVRSACKVPREVIVPISLPSDSDEELDFDRVYEKLETLNDVIQWPDEPRKRDDFWATLSRRIHSLLASNMRRLVLELDKHRWIPAERAAELPRVHIYFHKVDENWTRDSLVPFVKETTKMTVEKADDRGRFGPIVAGNFTILVMSPCFVEHCRCVEIMRYARAMPAEDIIPIRLPGKRTESPYMAALCAELLKIRTEIVLSEKEDDKNFWLELKRRLPCPPPDGIVASFY